MFVRLILMSHCQVQKYSFIKKESEQENTNDYMRKINLKYGSSDIF